MTDNAQLWLPRTFELMTPRQQLAAVKAAYGHLCAWCRRVGEWAEDDPGPGERRLVPHHFRYVTDGRGPLRFSDLVLLCDLPEGDNCHALMPGPGHAENWPMTRHKILSLAELRELHEIVAGTAEEMGER
jgi:hypothetical protein